MSSLRTNVLFYGDNLPVLRDMPDESVDLIYLDPPFNSNSDYNAIFRDESGQRSDAQIKAFEDTWHWGPSAQEHYDYLTNTGIHKGRVPDPVTGMVGAFIQALGKNQMTAYLVEMTVRIIELQRILKSTGSLYLHCDPTASHYLKLVLDASFGPERFRNEIIWRRTAFHGKVKRFGPIHDVILYYTKSDKFTFHAQTRPYMRGHVEAYFKQDERGWKTAYYGNVMTGAGTSNGESGQPWRGIDPTAKGRHWAIPGALLVGFEEEVAHMGQREKMDFLFEKGIIKLVEGQAWPMYERYLSPGDGMSVGDIWSYQPYTEGTVFGTEAGIDADVRWLSPQDKERLGYPTQKPVALLERIISASSNPGDVVLDPFCGCGTSVAAAQQLGRRWVGIDLTYLSIAVMKKRMQDHFPELGKIEVIGAPTELEGARRLAADEENGRYQFQWWALDQIGGTPRGADKKKGADGGIDGIISFSDARGVQSVIVSVKSGGVQAKDIRELNHVVEREKAAIGILVTLEEPSKPMRDEAAQAGAWQSELYNKSYPKIQIITAREIIEEGKMPDLPPLLAPQYRQAERVKKSAGDQGGLFDE